MPKPGIRVRHSRTCRSEEGGRCNCKPAYEASVWDARSNRQIRKSWPTEAAAKTWRADYIVGLRRGTLKAPTAETVRQAAEAWLEAAERGEIRSRNKRAYKPSSLRGYRHDFETYVYPTLGGRRLSDVTHDDMQRLLDDLIASGLSGSKARNVLVPLQALYRRHKRQIPVDPTDGLDLPEPGATRDRVASPAEAERLLAALDPRDQALWATAFLAGLRRGELRALRDADVDLDRNRISVCRSWDDVEGEIAPKSQKGVRKVPVPPQLRLHLLEHRARTGRRGSDLLFGRTATEPFTPTTIRDRARAAWAATVVGEFFAGRSADLEPIGLHECRHTYVSLMHAAGVPLERIGDYVGHSSAYMTDKYRHLIEGQGDEDAALMDDLWSTNAKTNARPLQAASLSGTG